MLFLLPVKWLKAPVSESGTSAHYDINKLYMGLTGDAPSGKLCEAIAHLEKNEARGEEIGS